MSEEFNASLRWAELMKHGVTPTWFYLEEWLTKSGVDTTAMGLLKDKRRKISETTRFMYWRMAVVQDTSCWSTSEMRRRIADSLSLRCFVRVDPDEILYRSTSIDKYFRHYISPLGRALVYSAEIWGETKRHTTFPLTKAVQTWLAWMDQWAKQSRVEPFLLVHRGLTLA